jgi:diaminohydroxyphosphoribosylaminopyrimidine deaminase/5-amino-6-(5-phosphoribosylamino)uracil reductase
MNPMGPPGDAPSDDARWMRRALELAEGGRGRTSPNPMVGAVVVSGGRAVGEGFHARVGGPHAEVDALAHAGAAARGATMYVTLEPCNHHGRTGPCVDAIVGGGIRRVVAAVADPNPRVDGGGSRALRAAGIVVRMDCLADEARRQNRVFFGAIARGRPHVTLKCAMTLDGKIAAADGSSRWITGEAARREAHRMRSEADAVAVGIGTALADDPSLDVRLPEPWPREPYRVIVDSGARLPVTARVLAAGRPERTLVAVADTAPADRVAGIAARGASVLTCRARHGRVDLEDLCHRLFGLEVIGLLVEGGSVLAAALLEAGLVDRAAFFIAPTLLGGAGAPTAVGGPGRPLAAAVHLADAEVRQVGDDWLFEADVRRDDGGPADGP